MKAAAVASLASVYLLTGCVSYQIPRYSIASENVAAFKRAGTSKLSVGAFKAESVEDNKIGSRACKGGGWLTTEDGKPFAEYIRRALISDLSIADRYDPASPKVVSGALKDISIDYLASALRLEVTATNSAGATADTVVTKKIITSLDPDTTCRNVKDALVPSMQDAIGELARSKVFAD